MKLLLAAVLGLASVAWGQEGPSSECLDKAMSFASCMQDGMEELHDSGEKEQRRALKDQCFVDNGCSAPERKTEEEKECMKEVVQSQLGPELQSCLSDQGLSVPEEFLVMALEGGRKMLKGARRHGRAGRRGGKGKGRKHQRKAEKLCPDEASAAAAVACLEGLREERRSGGFQAKWARMQEKMAVLGRCQEESGLDRECMTELKAVKEGACQCGQSLAEDSELVSSLAEGLSQCRENDDDEEEEEMGRGGRKLKKLFKAVCGGRGGRGGPGGRRGGGGRRFGGFGKGRGFGGFHGSRGSFN